MSQFCGSFCAVIGRSALTVILYWATTEILARSTPPITADAKDENFGMMFSERKGRFRPGREAGTCRGNYCPVGPIVNGLMYSSAFAALRLRRDRSRSPRCG